MKSKEKARELLKILECPSCGSRIVSDKDGLDCGLCGIEFIDMSNEYRGGGL